MSTWVYIDGLRGDVQRFLDEIIQPEVRRLRRDDIFKITQDDHKFYDRNKSKNIVGRKFLGYSPELCRNKEFYEKYKVEIGEPKKIGRDLEGVTDVQVKIALRGPHAEIKLLCEEFLFPKSDIFIIEKDTGIYTNMKKSGSRHIGGHFSAEKV